MFDHHIICDEGFRNVEENGSVIGFALLARLALLPRPWTFHDRGPCLDSGW